MNILPIRKPRQPARHASGHVIPEKSPAQAVAFADGLHGLTRASGEEPAVMTAASAPWAGAQVPDMEAPRDPYEDPGATALLSTIATPPPPFVPATARVLAPRGRHGRPDIALLEEILAGLRNQPGEPGAYLRAIPPSQHSGGPASPLSSLPAFAGTVPGPDGRRIAGVYLGAPDAEGRWVIDTVSVPWLDALIAAATQARDSIAYSQRVTPGREAGIAPAAAPAPVPDAIEHVGEDTADEAPEGSAA